MEEGLEQLNQHSYNMEKSDVTESDALKIDRLVEPSPHLEAVRDTEKNSILHKTVNAEISTSATVRETVNYKGDNFSEEPSRVEFSLQDANKGSDGPSHDNLHKQPREDRDEIEEEDSELHKEDFQKDMTIYPSIFVAPKDISQEYERSAKSIDSTIEETNNKSDDVELKIPSVHSSPIADADIRNCREDDEGLSSTQRLGNNEERNKTESKTLKDGETIVDKFTTAEEVLVPDSENKDVNIETTDKIGSEVVEEKNIGEEILVCNQENQPMSDQREREISEPSTINLDGSSPETTDGVKIVEERIEDGVTKKTENDAPLKEAAQETEEIFDEKHEKGSDEKYFKLADEEETEPTEMGISIEKGKNASEKNIADEANKDQLEINTTELDKIVQEVIDLNEHIEGTTVEECALEEQNRCIASVEEDPSNHTIQTGYLVNANPIENSDQALNENNRETISERQIVEKGETLSEIPVTATNEKFGANKDTNLENSADEFDQHKHEKVIGSVPDTQYFQEIKDGTESEESKSTEKQSIVGKISTSETLVETGVQTKDAENCCFQNPPDFGSKEQHTQDDGRKTMEKETETERIHEIQSLEDLSCMPTEEMILETLKSGEEQEEATQEREASSLMSVNDSIDLQLSEENSVKGDETSSDTIDKAYTVSQIPIQNTTNVIELEARESKGDDQGTEGVSEMPTQEQVSELSNKIENAVTGIVKDDNNAVLDTTISGKVINEEATYLRNEKVDEICKEENNVKFELHHIAQLTEKVHPINEEESKKLDDISELKFDEGRYFEKVPDKADPSNEIVTSDVPVVSEDQVREGSKNNDKSSENPEDVSNTCMETIADIGPIESGSGNDHVIDQSILEASEREKAPGASEVKTKKSSIEGVDEDTSVHQCNKNDPESSSLKSNFKAVSRETEESRGNNSIPEKENKDFQGVVLNVAESSQEEEKIYVVEKADGEKSTQEDKKLTSESMLDDQIEETNSESVATNIHDSIDGDNPAKKILMVHQNDESETAKWKDEDNRETNVRDINCDPHQQTEGTIREGVDNQHQETINSGFKEELLLEVEGKNEDDVKEKNKNTEKLEINSETVPEGQTEEFNSEPVATDIHDMIDPDNQEKEQVMKMVNLNDEPAIVCGILDSQGFADQTICERVDNLHEETTNSGCEDDTRQMMNEDNNQVDAHQMMTEDNNQVDVQDKNKAIEKLAIISKSASEDQIEDTNVVSVETNIHHLIDDDHKSETEIITMANLNDETEIANLKDENKEIIVCDIVDSHELAKGAIHDKASKGHDKNEITNFECQEETLQTVNEDSNKVDIQEERTVVERREIGSKPASENLLEETQSESVATNINDLIDDDNNPETERILTMANLNDETEIANLMDGDEETVVCDIVDSHELAKGIIHDKAGKEHDEIANFEWQEETQQTVNEDSNEFDIQEEEEKTVVEKLEIASESASENLLEEMRSESVKTNINDLIDDDNNPETEVITMNNLNDETEIANLKDEDKETVICDISNSHVSAKGDINDKDGKRHDEITNFVCQKETQQTVNAKDSNKVDIPEEKMDFGKLETTSESASENLFEEMRSESVATNIHDLIDDDNNPETEIMANLNDETELANLKDEDKETVVCDISNSHESGEGALCDKAGEEHQEITNFDCQEETQQTVNVEDNNEVDILEEKTDVRKPSESAFEKLCVETRSESVASNIHDLIDDDNNPETEIITMANLNDETEITSLKDVDKETVVCDISNSHESAKETINDKVGKGHDEITNFECQKETQQMVNVEDSNKINILEEKTDLGKLKITSESTSQNLFEETRSESVATNIHDSIDDDNNPETEQIITIAKLNDETEKAKLRDEDNKETVVCDSSNSHESVEGAIHDKAGEVHDETTTFECREKNQQSVNVEDSNKVDIQEEKTDVEKLETTLVSKSESLIGETYTDSVATDIHGLIDDDNNPETELITTMANLNDEAEIAKMKEEDNKEMSVCDIPGLTEFVEGAIHNKVGKRYEETTNFECQEETRQTVKAKDSNEIGNHEENRNAKKLEISSESVPEDQIGETDGVLVVTNIHDSIDPENEKRSPGHLKEESENVNVNDEEESEDKRLNGLPVDAPLADKAAPQNDEKESTTKLADLTDMTLNNENLEAMSKIMISQDDNYEIVGTETLATNDKESTCKNVQDSPVIPTPVGETSEAVEERHEKAPHDPSEEQIHQGISEIDVNTTGSGVSKEDISESALSTSQDLVKEKTSTDCFSAEGDDCSHQEREHTKSLEITYSEEAKTIEEAESMPNKQPQNIEVEFSCEEDINGFDSEKNKEDKTDTEKAIAVRLGTSFNMASEEPEAAIQTEPPWEQTKVATEAVKGNDKVVAESMIKSQENSKTNTGQNSIEVDDEKCCDTVNNFSSANEASAETNIQKNASEEEPEGLIHDIEDGCVSSETKAQEDETQDVVQPEKKVCQTIEGGESDKKESLDKKKTSEKNHPDVNFGKSLQEDENKEHEKVFVSDAAEGATLDELHKLASVIGGEKVEEMDEIKKNTEKMVIVYSDTDTWVEQPTNVEALGYHSQMDKIELPTLENVGTEVGEKHERTEELNTELQEDSKELRKYEHIPTVVLERVKAAESSEKTERNITVEEDISEAPGACLKQETEDEHFPEDGTKVQKKATQTKCEIDTTDTMVDKSLNEEDKEFDSTPSKNFSRTIFTDKTKPLMEKLDKQKIVEATPDAYMETEVSHEQFQKDDIVSDNEKPQHKWELDSTYITKDQSPNDEVKELDCKPSEESVDLENETTLFVDLQDEKKNPDVAPGACMKDESRKDELDKEIELGIEKKETQTPWEPNFTDKENEPSNNNVEERDCIPTEQNAVIAFAEKLDTTLLTNDEGEKQCFDATIDACMKDETSHAHHLKDGIKAEKNNEQETRWELQSTDDMEFDSSPSEENTFTTVWTEKIRNLLTEEDVKKNVGVAASSCAEHETNHEQFQTDDITAEKNKEPYNKRELERTYAEANESPNNEVCLQWENPESPNNEVNELDSNFPEWNSMTILSTDKLDIGILMDEGNEKKNIALPHTTRPAEEIEHEVDPTNVASKYMRSTSTQDEVIPVNLAKETIPEDPTEVHKLDVVYPDTGSIEKPINIDDITHDVNDRGEEIPEWTPIGVQVSEDSRIETLSQDERKRTGEESNLDSKLERMQQTEEDSNEGLQFDISQDEEKHRDCNDLPVSRLLLQHILRNNSDMQDQATNAGPEENIQEMNGKRIVCTGVEKQGETFSDELEESHETLEDTSQLLEKEDIHDVQQNTASAVAREAETPQSSISSPSLSESKDITDNEQISKDDSTSVSLSLKQATDGTRISKEKACPEELENTSELVIDEVNHYRKEKTEISEVKDDENQSNLHGSSIFTMNEGVKDEVSSLLSDVSTHENAPMTTENNGKSGTPDSENDQKDHSTIDEKRTSNSENVHRDSDFSSMDKNYQEDNSHTKAEEKSSPVSETVGYTDSILQSEETETSPRYNQNTKSYEPMSEIHVHANEQASEIKPDATIRKEELREENDDEITEMAQNVDSYSSEEPNMSYSEEVQQSNIMSANETLQTATRPLEGKTTEISKEKNQTKEKADPQTDEDKTDEEKDEVEEVDDHKIEDGGQNVAVTVEERDAGSKKAHKKSHNILSGVGSKVKNSLAKVKKAIIGKSSQPKAASPK